jgi:hypothetical protein
MDFFKYIEQQTRKVEESYVRTKEYLADYEERGEKAIIALNKFAELLGIEEPNIFFTPNIFCSSIIYFETEQKTQEEILNIVIKEGFKHIVNTTRFSCLFDSQYITVDKNDGVYTRVEIRMPNFEKF